MKHLSDNHFSHWPRSIQLRSRLMIFGMVCCLAVFLSAETAYGQTARDSDHFQSIFSAASPEAKDSLIRSSIQASSKAQSEAELRTAVSIASTLKSARYFDEALQIYENVEASVSELGDDQFLAEFYIDKGLAAKNLERNNLALDAFFASLQIGESKNLTSIQKSATLQIGILKKALGNNSEALQYFEKSLELAKTLNSNYDEAAIYNNIGSVFKAQGEMGKAREYILKAIEINKSEGFQKNLSYNYNNLANIYEESDDLENALLYQTLSLDLKVSLQDWPSTSIGYTNMALIYYKKGDFQQALNYNQKAKQLAEAYKVHSILPVIYATDADIKNALGKHEDAYHALQSLISLRDSLEVVDLWKMSSSHESSYQIALLEKANEALKEQVLLKEAEMKRKGAVLVTLIMSVALLFALVVAYYFTTLKKARSSQELNAAYSEIKAENWRLKEQVLRLERTWQKVQQTESDKEILFATISHDLRGPINAFNSLIPIIRDELNDDRLNEYFEVLEYSSLALNSLVDDILDFSKIGQRPLKIDWKPVKMADLLKVHANAFQFLAREKEIDLIFEIKLEHEHYKCDPKRMSQILFNLLDHAFRNTQDGYVKLILKDHADGQKKGVRMQVSDSSTGLEKPALELIRNAFGPDSERMDELFNQVGIALLVTKRICLSFQGQFFIESQPQSGTTISIFLPLEPIS